MYKQRVFSLNFAVFVVIMCVANAFASVPFSQSGVIQNVQNYSGNPFYNPDSYVVTTPKIVYASGPALKPRDCEFAVQSVIETVCGQRNNCKNTTLADVRPTVMVTLSKLPGANYSSSCSGYVDTIYENYMKKNQAVYSVVNTGFPVGNGVNVNQNAVKKTESNYATRAAELKALQAQTKTTVDTVTATDFPKTFDDLSFAQQNEIKWQGYEPFKDAQVYVPLNVHSEDRTKMMTEEVAAVEKCIRSFGAAESSAEDALCADTTSTDKKSKLVVAVKNAILSACTCTQGKRTVSELRKTLGVKCDTSFIESAGNTAQGYVDSL